MPIVIHRCHNSVDQGNATPAGLTEHAIAAAVNVEMLMYLEERGHACRMLEGDLTWRIDEANALHQREGVPCTVEVHCNAMPGEDGHQAEGFFAMCWHGSRLAAMLGECIVREVALIRPGAPNRYLNFVSSHRRWMYTPRMYANAPRLAMLQDTYMPAVIVEACYLSNPGEAKWIADQENRQALGRAVAKGIVNYLQER